MEYAIIGTGNVAWFLAERLMAAGWTCSGIYGRHTEAAAELAGYCHAPVYTGLSAVKDMEGHICLLAVSDSAIAAIAGQMDFKHTVLVHTSGTSSIDLLRPAAPHCGVFWPVYSIIRGHLPASVPVAWEAADDTARQAIALLADRLASVAVEAGGEQRRQLHLSAVFTNNYVNHLVAIGQRICSEQGLSFELLQPMLQQTFERLMSIPAADAQTGPARRGDTVTLQQHQELLAAHPLWQELYRDMAASIQEMYPPVT